MRAITLRVAGASFSQNFTNSAFSSIFRPPDSGGAFRTVGEDKTKVKPSSECLQELNERRLVVGGQVGSEQVPAVDHEVRTLAQLKHVLHHIAEHPPRIVVARVRS